jgi:low temperature requirement protein LtrA
MLEHRLPNAATVGGYVVMRLALVAQWLRAAAADRERRVTARRYALGIALLQAGWVGTLSASGWWAVGFAVLVLGELAVPAWAERAASTPWHPHHIAERYGLMTIIVLGESVLAATVAIQSALASGEALSALLPLILGGLVIVYTMWWAYFSNPSHDRIGTLRGALVWGYGHYFVFASAAAVGAGLAVAADQVTDQTRIGVQAAGAAVAVPVALFVLSLWFLHDRPEHGSTRVLGPLAAGLILLTPFTGQAVPWCAAILVAALVLKERLRRRQSQRPLTSP